MGSASADGAPRLPTPLDRGEWVPGLYPKDRLGSAIALTFDDVPRKNFAPYALDQLARYNVPATFFVEGDLARVLPDSIRRMVAEGHEVGNHSWSHANLASLAPDAIDREFERTQRIVSDALGASHPMPLIRPPFGAPWYGRFDVFDRAKVARAIAKQDGACVLWQRSSHDTLPGATAKRVYDEVTEAVDKSLGGIFVFHPTVAARRALPRILKMLREREVEVVTVTELLQRKYGCSLTELLRLPTRLSPRPKLASSQ
ncbi:MAG: peptidoglycan/xylan/chitin deacetylase (PgdA/CDA1 family) [Myxococcota bacterium]